MKILAFFLNDVGKTVKVIFLVLILAIPAWIFTFLKFFGDNKFDVEVFYSEGINTPIGECDQVNGQFFVPDNLLPSIGKNSVVVFDQGDLKSVANISARLKDTFIDDYQVIVYSQDSLKNESSELFQVRIVNDLTITMKCGFINKDPNALILVDKNNRIRGYYSRDLDEIDRLIVELKIIIENDQRIGG